MRGSPVHDYRPAPDNGSFRTARVLDDVQRACVPLVSYASATQSGLHLHARSLADTASTC
jgi:hypothetical protein